MKYPAIYQSTVNGNVALLLNDKQGVTLDKFKATVGTSGEWDEDKFKNITAEYLANTYGEVKSKEHAEFIVRLAEVNGIAVSVNCRDGSAKVFSFRTKSGVPRLVLLSTKDHLYNAASRKQITIPLPPECESVDDKKPLKVLSSGKVYTFNEVTGRYDYGIAALGFITSKDIEKLKETDDYEVISFVNDDSLDGEWPKVGDEVQTNFGKGVVKLPTDTKCCYVIDINGNYHQLKRDELSHPKTPEQELRDFISLLWDENNHDFDMFLDIVTEHVIKKPQ